MNGMDRATPPVCHSRKGENPAPVHQEESVVELSNRALFQTLNGLWKGKKGPFVRAIVIRNTNFTADGTLDLDDVAELDVEEKQLATRTLQRGDIIVERSGGGPKQAVGRVCYFDAAGDLPYSFSNFTSVVRVLDHQRLLPRYVHYYLLHLYKDGYTEGLQHATTGIRNLDFSSYLEARVPDRPLPEQQKIAAILWKLQRAIATQDKLLKATADLKQSAMQHLFTQGLRGEPLKETEIGPMPARWSVRSLGDFGRIGNGSTPKKTRPEYWRDGATPWLTSAKVHEGIISSADQYVSEVAVKQCHLPVVPAGSLLVAITGQGKTLGNAALVEFDTTINQHLAYVRFDHGDVNPAYVYQFMRSRYEELQAVGRAGGSTKAALTCAFLRDYRVPCPPLDEQRDIAAALATLDRKLTQHRRKRAALDALFQTTLHQLMTGEVRVADLDIDTSEVTDPADAPGEAA